MSGRRNAVMSEPYNPYQPPAAPAAPATAQAGVFSAEGRAVDPGRGWEWIAEGFALFKKQPGTWILILIVWVVCSILISLVPAIGTLANLLLMQVFMGGVMLGCRALDRGESFDVGCVFAGFKQNTGDLVVLGLLALVGWIIAFIPALLIMGGGAFMAMMGGGGPMANMGALGLTFVLALLVALALAVPLYMAMWFAPSLVVFNNLKPVDAMKASFLACLKNIVPFLLYGIIVLALCVVAAIPLGLGFLVLGPVVIASVYTGYRDIFVAG
jgi:hypothetical protein